jgi:hypothetical protein
MPITTPTNIDYLIMDLRLQLGDTNAGSYRYLDEWLRTALIGAVKALQSWWHSRYIVTTSVVGVDTFYTVSPAIAGEDERPIILMASIIIKGGSLENSAYSIASWRDNEIAYSNIAGGQLRNSSLDRDWQELLGFLKPPTKTLAGTKKNSLPGYQNNRYESLIEPK